MKNIELKVRVKNFGVLRHALKLIGASHHGKILHQTDVYFNCHHGRLKLRTINNMYFELIYYIRPTQYAPKVSTYEILTLGAKQTKMIKKMLKQSLGKTIVVQKKRELWIYKNTRIHFDTVQKLGTFVELETVVKNITPAKAKEEHKKLIKLLNLKRFPKIKESYSDLLRNIAS